ncbi:unnamed protein product [Tilletia controversa]|nr:unnamed protein product [Tilletia controversa]
MAGIVEHASVYTISGAGAGPSNSTASLNSTSLPDILRRSGSNNKRKKRRRADAKFGHVDDQIARIELIQDFEFPEASNRVRSSRDGLHIVATGTYKPQIRVWECEQLALKFERHTDAENVDFLLLSDDWTKSLHLQSDRTLEIHSQGGTHARIRIPKFGRALGYHFPSADAVVGAAGRDVFRLNLDQGRFLAPFELGGGHAEAHGTLTGVNALDINPAHGLASFGTEGAGVVELWDMRIRKRAGLLSIMTSTILDSALMSSRRALPGVTDLPSKAGGGSADEAAIRNAVASLSVTALASADDGLNLAVGTSTGHTLLYDLRMNRPYQSKDQGFGLPIKSLIWPGSNLSGLRKRSAAAAAASSSDAPSDVRNMVLSADAKIIKVWNSETGENAATITPPSSGLDLNDVHHIPGTGLVLGAVEGTQMAAWYVPLLGPAPKWCSFLDNLTTEMDAGGAGAGSKLGGAMGGSGKGVYEDFKFVDQAELERLNMAHLVGTALLRPPAYSRTRRPTPTRANVPSAPDSKRIANDVKEFLEVKDVKSGVEGFTLLPVDRRSQAIAEFVDAAINKKEADVQNVTKLFHGLSEDSVVTEDQAADALKDTVTYLQDFEIDAPNAFTWIAGMLVALGLPRSRVEALAESMENEDNASPSPKEKLLAKFDERISA